MSAHDIVLLNGQSNANLGMENALRNCLQDRSAKGVVARFNENGSSIKNWIDANGVKGPNWTAMMAAFDAAVQPCITLGNSINSLTLVYWQGEGDTVPAGQGGAPSPFLDCFKQFMTCFIDEAVQMWGFTPSIAAGLIHIDFNHPAVNNNPVFVAGLPIIRNETQQVVDCFLTASTFETDDLAREDHVHLASGSAEQDIAAKRALAVTKRRCNQSD